MENFVEANNNPDQNTYSLKDGKLTIKKHDRFGDTTFLRFRGSEGNISYYTGSSLGYYLCVQNRIAAIVTFEDLPESIQRNIKKLQGIFEEEGISIDDLISRYEGSLTSFFPGSEPIPLDATTVLSYAENFGAITAKLQHGKTNIGVFLGKGILPKFIILKG